MRIACIGAGPAGLYFAVLMKKAFPDSSIDVYEKNRAEDAFGWGVVFSRETLGNLKDADPESYAAIESRFAYWDDIETWVGREKTVSTGHGFCGLARRELLEILQQRAEALGVRLHFQAEVPTEPLPQVDLIIGSDGVHSPLREKYASVFKPSIEWGQCKFTWLGTTKPLQAFTFIFKQTQWGLFAVHAYPFTREPMQPSGARSTFIVECHHDTWQKAGLEHMTEAQSVDFLQRLFADDLGGHALCPNKSIWRTFPTVKCETWRHGNLVLLGDAAHTAHFSIGSGTKLALEDALSLAALFVKHGAGAVEPVLAAYETERHGEVARIQKAAQTSLEWFEHTARYSQQTPLQLTFNLMTRSKRITWSNLRQRDPRLVERIDSWFAEQHGTTRNSDGSAPPPLFAPLTLRSLTLPNRVVVSPMCQYSATDGVIDDWHLVHLGSRAVGGAGLVITEMTDVCPEGRITPGCAGVWNEAQASQWKRVVEFVHRHSSAKIGIQLAHAGRKAARGLPWQGEQALDAAHTWPIVGPSAIAFSKGYQTPRALTVAELTVLTQQFADAAKRADWAGFDLVELHAAHGYLLSSFLSPLSNVRTDEYGGSLENRMRFPLQVFDAVRAVWPSHKPVFVRISATDWLEPDGMTTEDSVVFSRALKAHGCDVVDVSTGGNVPDSKPDYGRMYQVPFAEAVRFGAGITTMTVGAILGADHANTVLAAGRADLCAMARPHLTDPYLTHQHAQAEGVDGLEWPKQYENVAPRLKAQR